MPILNEVRFLDRAIGSLMESGYPLQKLEFILVDGGSEDGTLELIDRLIQKGLNIRLMHNQMKTTPFALNIGIQAATQEIVLRADAHAIYEENYISRSVELLQSGAGDNIGGIVTSISGDTQFSKLLSFVLNSRLGNGGVGYRKSNQGRLVDTVWCGCWYKSTLEEVGMFDVNWINNQDAELNARMIANGFKVFSDPSIKASLVVRPTLMSFIQQYFRYGRGRFRTLRRHPHIMRIRQILPILAVSVFCAGLFLSPLSMLVIIAIFSIGATLAFRQKKSFRKLPIVMQLFVCPVAILMNVAWVAGLLYQSIYGGILSVPQAQRNIK